MGRLGRGMGERVRWEGGETVRYVIGVLLLFIGSGPLLLLTIKQVCVSKCLLLRRLPVLASDLEDLLLVVLFAFYVLLNYVLCRALWGLLCKGLLLACRELCGGVKSTAPTTLFDPKVTRSGRPYGYRTARYIRSDTSSQANGC